MKYDTDIPIYIQIIEKIKKNILNGTLAQGERLPSIQDMAVAMEVNQNTVCRVYKECEALGMIETKRGIGSFVVDDQKLIERLRTEQIRLIVDGFVHSLQELGLSKAEILKVLQRNMEDNA